MDTDSVGLTACGEEPGMGAQQHRRKFTSEFKDEAVRLVNDSGRPIAEVGPRHRGQRGDVGQLGQPVALRARR